VFLYLKRHFKLWRITKVVYSDCGLKDLIDTPIQLCHFHQVSLVIRKLTRKQKSEAGKELKELVKTLKNSTKKEFYRHLNEYIRNTKITC